MCYVFLRSRHFLCVHMKKTWFIHPSRISFRNKWAEVKGRCSSGSYTLRGLFLVHQHSHKDLHWSQRSLLDGKLGLRRSNHHYLFLFCQGFCVLFTAVSTGEHSELQNRSKRVRMVNHNHNEFWFLSQVTERQHLSWFVRNEHVLIMAHRWVRM